MGLAFFGIGPLPGPTVEASLTTRSVNAGAVDPFSANCYYKIDDNGSVYGGSNTGIFLETWRDVGSNPDFEVYFDHISGTFPADINITWDTWLVPDVDRTVILGRTGIGSNTSVIEVSIRDEATQTVLTTATITMIASVIENPE
jgi:hypothetical protein